MSELFAPVCSIMLTKRRRFFWAAWWSGPPTRVPFRKPDACDGGARSFEEARAAAEKAAGTTLGVIDPLWARAYNRVLRGQPAWPNGPRDAEPASVRRETSPANASLWELLGVGPGVTDEELKAAFRKKALATHPDQGGDAETFRRVLRAYTEARRRVRKPKRKTP